jgi:hypothetical protein
MDIKNREYWRKSLPKFVRGEGCRNLDLDVGGAAIVTKALPTEQDFA